MPWVEKQMMKTDELTYGKRWHWAGAQQEHAAPLYSPNPDYVGGSGEARTGYNAADAQSPQKATYQVDTAAGDVKHLYGQGRPMAWQATGDGADYSSGEESDGGGGTVTVESRLYFDGTVDAGATTGELSRMTDAREKGRIGILGSALSYAGSYGRVTSESIGAASLQAVGAIA